MMIYTMTMEVRMTRMMMDMKEIVMKKIMMLRMNNIMRKITIKMVILRRMIKRKIFGILKY